MITVLNQTTDNVFNLIGLAADLTNVPACKNGSMFFAMDEGKTYYYDEENETWIDPTAEE